MMFRAVAHIVLPLTLSTFLWLPGTAQTAGQTASPAPSTSQQPTGAATIGSSTSLGADSNEVASLYGDPVVEIVARVNDRVITNDDLKRAQTQLSEDARQNNWNIDQYDAAQKNLLRDLIDQQLLLSKGKQLGITGDTELIKRLDEIRKQNHLASLDDLEKAVEQQGTSYEDFKANIRNSIITQQVVRDEVGSKLQLTQADIRKYYESHLDSFTQPESVHLNEILIPTAENVSPADLSAAEAKARGVEARLKAGGSFADLAKQSSGGPTADQGGDLGDFKRGALAKVLEDQTFNLPVGGYTEPIRTRQGYIILEVSAHNPGGTLSLQKAEPQIEQAIYGEKIEPAVRQYLTRLREEAYIDIRPGNVDSASSSNETKPTFTAYVPPQPKKKKKKHLYRFEDRGAKYGRLSDRAKTAPVATGSTAAPAPAAARAAATTTGRSRFRRVRGTKPATHTAKREKLRYGRAPRNPVSDEQVATTAAPAPAAAPAPDGAAEASATDAQPLGPDLEHAPTITQPKQHKTRFSDEARVRQAQRAKTKHAAKVKKPKIDNARPTALTSAEQQNQQVQSAPLGLAGDTTKKKKRKPRVKNGEKVRYSDEKKSDAAGTGTAPPSSTQQQQ